jgi:hypothetical protein
VLILSKGTSHKIQLITSASGDIEASYSVVDKTGTGPSSYSYAGVGEPLASITTATTTDIVAGATSTERSIRRLSFFNAHASTSNTLTVQEVDGTDTVIHQKVTLAAGESLVLDAAGVWSHYDPNGGPYVGVGPVATQAEMEAGTSTTTVVTPANFQWHPGACKFWIKATPGGTINASYNVTSEADATAGVCDITIATDFSSANYAVFMMSARANTNTTVTDAKNTAIRSGTMAAGSISVETYDQTATNVAIEDPSYWVCGGFGDQ